MQRIVDEKRLQRKLNSIVSLRESAGNDPNDKKLSKAVDLFWCVLRSEVDAINETFTEHENLCSETMKEVGFSARVKPEPTMVNAFHRAFQDAHPTIAAKHKVNAADVADQDEYKRASLFIQLCNSLDCLRKFVVINYMVIVKILKLYHANNRGHEAKVQAFLPELTQEEFYSSPILASLLQQAEKIVAMMFPNPSPVPTKRCPLCNKRMNEPFMLPCKDIMCFSCLANQQCFGQQCPVCKATHDLSPMSIHLQGILCKSVGLLCQPRVDPSESTCFNVLSCAASFDTLANTNLPLRAGSDQKSFSQGGRLSINQYDQAMQLQSNQSNFLSQQNNNFLSQSNSMFNHGNKMNMGGNGFGNSHQIDSGPFGTTNQQQGSNTAFHTEPSNLNNMLSMEPIKSDGILAHHQNNINNNVHDDNRNIQLGDLHSLASGGSNHLDWEVASNSSVASGDSFRFEANAKSMGNKSQGDSKPIKNGRKVKSYGRNASKSGTKVRHHVSCHQCKTTKSREQLLFCTTKAAAGIRKRKCRKKYCDACLQRWYAESVGISEEAKQHWRCPACLGTCRCAACHRKANQELKNMGVDLPPMEVRKRKTSNSGMNDSRVTPGTPDSARTKLRRLAATNSSNGPRRVPSGRNSPVPLGQQDQEFASIQNSMNNSQTNDGGHVFGGVLNPTFLKYRNSFGDCNSDADSVFSDGNLSLGGDSVALSVDESNKNGMNEPAFGGLPDYMESSASPFDLASSSLTDTMGLDNLMLDKWY